MDENTITLNQYNVLGQKIDVDINKIKNNEKLEYVILKNFNVTNKIMLILETLKNIKKVWFVNCNIIEKIKLNNIDSIRIENCENISNICYEQNINYLYINNCKEFDVNTIVNLDLKGFELEYTIPQNLQVLCEMKCLETLSLKEIDLIKGHLNIPKSLRKIILNGSKVANKEVVMNYFKEKNIQIEFLDKNLPIG